MVKANGYGLGAVAVAQALEALDPWGFGVATTEEALELRAADIRRPIVVFTPLAIADIDLMLSHDLRPVVGDIAALQVWCGRGEAPYHLEIDTGMGRAGIRWDDHEALGRVGELADRGREGVFTHFHSAESAASTEEQWQRFEGVLSGLGSRPPLVHAANSAAALAGPRYAGDLVRPGIYLYGGSVAGRTPRPVVRLRTRVVAVRRVRPGDSVSYLASWTASEPAEIATLGIGYGDGLPRALSNRGHIELDGCPAPIVGNVTMDMTMVAPAEPVEVGAIATIFGGSVTLDQQATAAGTIAYELLTGLGTRVRRRYGNPT